MASRMCRSALPAPTGNAPGGSRSTGRIHCVMFARRTQRPQSNTLAATTAATALWPALACLRHHAVRQQTPRHHERTAKRRQQKSKMKDQQPECGHPRGHPRGVGHHHQHRRHHQGHDQKIISTASNTNEHSPLPNFRASRTAGWLDKTCKWQPLRSRRSDLRPHPPTAVQQPRQRRLAAQRAALGKQRQGTHPQAGQQ